MMALSMAWLVRLESNFGCGVERSEPPAALGVRLRLDPSPPSFVYAIVALVVMSCVWIDCPAGFVLHCQVDLERARGGDHVAREERAVVGQHSRAAIAINHMDRHTVESFAVLPI